MKHEKNSQNSALLHKEYLYYLFKALLLNAYYLLVKKDNNMKEIKDKIFMKKNKIITIIIRK